VTRRTVASDVLAGRYKLVSRIAAGAAGEVWRGSDLVLGRPVAVKLLRAQHAHDAETLTRFRAEARHTASLADPGVAQVYDYGDGDASHPPFLVLELVEGPSLARLLEGGPLDAASAMDLIAQAATGLHAAHQARLVHRDIKPGNLLIGPGGQVKITDFGIAFAAGSAPVTRTGMLVGTPAYLAPERVAGVQAGPASDLYSLGIVAWECLAGAPPFSGTMIEVAVAHRDRALPDLPNAVPGEVADLVAELTAKDPAARPTAAETADRAGALRDAVRAGTTLHRGTFPYATLAEAGPETLADAQPGTLAYAQPGTPLPPWHFPQRPSGGRAGVPWRPVAAVIAVAVAAALLGVLLAAVPGPAPTRGPARPSARPSPAASTAPSMVEVNGGALIGQPVAAAARQLRHLGLVVSVQWRPAAQQQPGTVMSVQPGGRVRAGSAVLVTGALPPRHKAKGHDKGNGHDKAKGPGHG
jgi:tRNA A-37 threonylcarbamoyl transferase component Bud32